MNILIRINKNGKYSLHLRFDNNGVNHLIGAFQGTVQGESVNIELDELSNIGSKKIKYLTISCNNEEDKLSYCESGLLLQLEDEVIEYVIDRLKLCLTGQDFYPAEFCEATFGKHDVTIYGFLEK
ncbi:hypothetical protein [Paenibacillus humicus]|uniref:hypothetical protein n=1 Tax=Paenibacillus humicus TaxID=412861 RepID=UPI003D2E24FA